MKQFLPSHFCAVRKEFQGVTTKKWSFTVRFWQHFLLTEEPERWTWTCGSSFWSERKSWMVTSRMSRGGCYGITNADWLISPPAAQILPGPLRERVRLVKIKETERVRIPSVPGFFFFWKSRDSWRKCMREALSPVISGESGRRPPPRRVAPRGRTSPYSPEMTGGTYISHGEPILPTHLAEVLQPVTFVLARHNRRMFNFGCVALSFQTFAASHPERLSLSTSLSLLHAFYSYLLSFSFKKSFLF